MRKRFDGHVHIAPLYQVGKKDPAVNAEYQAYGKVVYSGKYVFRAMPDYIADSRFPVESLIEVMTNAGVERAVIQQSESKRMNVEILSAVESYPDRLKGAMTIRPQERDCAKQIELLSDLGLSVIKMITAQAMGIKGAYCDVHFDQEPCLSLWKIAQERRLTLAIDAGSVGNPGYREKEWRNVLQRFPDLNIVFCHMAFPNPSLTKEQRDIYRSALELLRFENCWMDVAAVHTFAADEVYPYPWAARTVRQVMDEYGPHKLIWATDIPSTLVDCTYRQMIDIYERNGLFSEEEKDMFFYKNACSAYRWPESI